MRGSNSSTLRRACFIGNHTPRQCGIATFTADLADSVRAHGVQADIVAINDRATGYEYPSQVVYQVAERKLGSYTTCADYLNFNEYDVACLQHEYGIFGGTAGSHVLALLRNLRMPLVTTLHTLLENPSPDQHRVLEEIVQLSQRVVVMSRRAKEMVVRQFGLDEARVDLIQHGTPDVPLICPSEAREMYGYRQRPTILTFGLLSPDKGIEYMIQALPSLVERHPDLLYVVLGATHPHVRKQTNDSYRRSLVALAKDLGVADNVQFEDRYVTLDELKHYLQAADIYATPYLKPHQITSGTLAYAFACGKPIVSTPYWHAEELLADDHGILTAFKDAKALGDALDLLLSNPSRRLEMAQRAYAAGREATWPNVGLQYLNSFEQARVESRSSSVGYHLSKAMGGEVIDKSRVSLSHLATMTDDTGLVQHAVGPVPNRHEGYSVDDNARALIICARLKRLGVANKVLDRMSSTYLSFLHHSLNPESNRFRNFMAYDRRWLEEVGSEDSHGRCIWGLGEWVTSAGSIEMRSVALALLEKAMPQVASLSSPRAWVYSMLGLFSEACPISGKTEARVLMRDLANRLQRLYAENSSPTWKWFEPYASYDNARISQAMLVAGQTFDDSELIRIGLESLDWLHHAQTGTANVFSPIGCEEVWHRGKPKPQFDQQPLEAWAMVDACLVASKLDDSKPWADRAQTALDWFYGRNDRSLALANPTTGGCHDGLQEDRVNENQGAESTLAYLGAITENLHFGQEENWSLTGVAR